AHFKAKALTKREFSAETCVHGHFLAIKYLPLADSVPCTFVTWLRDPLARLISHYHYWRRSYDPKSISTTNLHRRVVEENWSLRRFCLSPELQNVYCEFLWAFPRERLKFIGISEYYPEELRYFSQEILGNNLPVETLNKRENGPRDPVQSELSDADRQEILAFHADDVALYRSALESRAHRMEGWSPS
ncbi:MAG: hypothetical protein AAGI44_07055, partial [Pseudomonadota bacterium]